MRCDKRHPSISLPSRVARWRTACAATLKVSQRSPKLAGDFVLISIISIIVYDPLVAWATEVPINSCVPSALVVNFKLMIITEKPAGLSRRV
jgi:hypothetical protein